MIGRAILTTYGFLKLSQQEQQDVLAVARRYAASPVDQKRKIVAALEAELIRDTSGTDRPCPCCGRL